MVVGAAEHHRPASPPPIMMKAQKWSHCGPSAGVLAIGEQHRSHCMRRRSTVLSLVFVLASVSPSLAQEDSGAGFGALVGGLVGSAVGAAVSGRAPRGSDLVPGHSGGSGAKGKAGGGATHAAASGGHAGGGQVHKKPGK